MTIDFARGSDLPELERLLASARLPLDGLSALVGSILVARIGKTIVGCAAQEIYSDGALLRSVAVSEEYRGQQLGHALTRAALQLASERGIDRVYLLTTTAHAFFPRFGFRETTRASVPQSIRESVEFTTACPASARVFVIHPSHPFTPNKPEWTAS